MTATFTVHGRPQGKARPRLTKTGKAYTPAKTKKYELDIKRAYINQCKGIYWGKDIPLRVEMIAEYPIPKSATKKRKDKMLSGELRPTVKPDTDNVIKAVLDGLNKVAYFDDSQVVRITVTKIYSEEPKVKILIRDYEGTDDARC